jgi:hypothetical protein
VSRDPERPFDQHIPDTLGHEDHSLGGDVYGKVTKAFVEGTRLQKILITGPSVRCHHQSVLDHPGLVASDHADDGTLEAIKTPSARSGSPCNGTSRPGTTPPVHGPRRGGVPVVTENGTPGPDARDSGTGSLGTSNPT